MKARKRTYLVYGFRNRAHLLEEGAKMKADRNYSAKDEILAEMEARSLQEAETMAELRFPKSEHGNLFIIEKRKAPMRTF